MSVKNKKVDNKPQESETVKDKNKNVNVNKEDSKASKNSEDALINSYKNTLALGEVAGKAPAWCHAVTLYGCELFKRPITKAELLILQDSIKGFSAFFSAIKERLNQVLPKEEKANKAKK